MTLLCKPAHGNGHGALRALPCSLRKALEKLQEVNKIAWGGYLQQQQLPPAAEQPAANGSPGGGGGSSPKRGARQDSALREPLLGGGRDVEAGLADGGADGRGPAEQVEGDAEEQHVLKSEKVPAALPACPPACLPARLPACPPARLLSAHLPARYSLRSPASQGIAMRMLRPCTPPVCITWPTPFSTLPSAPATHIFHFSLLTGPHRALRPAGQAGGAAGAGQKRGVGGQLRWPALHPARCERGRAGGRAGEWARRVIRWGESMRAGMLAAPINDLILWFGVVGRWCWC